MSQLKKYLNYYRTLTSPGYAVLVTGAWGVGKTYQVKDALKSKYYYVSLFGLESKEEIEAALLTAANPSLTMNKKLLGHSTEKAKEVGGLYSLLGVIPSAINSLLKIELNRNFIIVFDDLERCTIELFNLLGIINWFVEHQNCKVVVIAHDEKIQENLQEQKEKVFGQTIIIEPELYQAFYMFLSEIKVTSFISKTNAAEAIKFIEKNRSLIISFFKPQVVADEQDNVHTYETNSLRVMKRSLFDIARLYDSIDPKFLSNEEAITHLMREFCIFNLEYKMGNLPAKSLGENWADETRLRWERRLPRNGEDNIPLAPLETLEKKYAEIKLDGLLLDQNFLYQAIVEGNYDTGLINKTLAGSGYFAQTKNLPSWRRFMLFDELEDEVVEQAKNELLDQFENRNVHEVGAMLHMFALRFMMSENAIITDGFLEVEQSCREYVDDLLIAGELLPRPTDGQWPNRLRFENNHGYSYWITDAYRDNFNNIHQYLNDARTEAFENQGADIAQEILTALKTDPEVFTKLISHRLGVGKYASVPVMHSIDIEELVSDWLSIPKHNWRTVQYAFDSRYEGGRLQNDEHRTGELVDELDWAIELRQSLEARAAMLDGYKRLRISRIIPNLPLANQIN